MDAMLQQLNAVLLLIQRDAATVGITLAMLMVVIYAMGIMLKNDNSPAARSTRWDNLQKVLICAGIIAAAGIFVTAVTAFFRSL